MRASAKERAARAARFAAPAPCSANESHDAPRASPKAVQAAHSAKKRLRESNDGRTGFSDLLEKPYLRLTGAVDWSKVRPPRVLQESLQLVQEKWKIDKDYNYASSQLKSIRQDLTVQHCSAGRRWLLLCIRTYETHARIALESADLSEMYQCLSALDELHRLGQEHPQRSSECTKHRDEFAAYRLLYAIHTENLFFFNTSSEYFKRRTDSLALAHAFAVLSAVRSNDFVNFFRLHERAPFMSAFLMDHLLDRVRRQGFQLLLKSSFPELELRTIQDQLRFHDSRKRRKGDMMQFLGSYKLTLIYDSTVNGKKAPRAIDIKALKKGSSSQR